MLLRKRDRVLFYGDSITDAGRFAHSPDGDAFGDGYVSIIVERAKKELAELNLEIVNRGIGGNRIGDLEARLEIDVLALRPDVVSVLIGINDTWRRYNSNDPSPVGPFQEAYRRVLGRMVDELSPRLVICEPFLLPIPEDRKAWREDLDPRIHAIRKIAREFGATYVPLDGAFAAAACKMPLEELAADGVHPTPAGAALIADAWLEAVTS